MVQVQVPASCTLSIWAETENGSRADLEWIRLDTGRQQQGTDGEATLPAKRKIPTEAESHTVHYKPRNGDSRELPFMVDWVPSVPEQFVFTGDRIKKVPQSAEATCIRKAAGFCFQDQHGNDCEKSGEIRYWRCEQELLKVSLSIRDSNGDYEQGVTLHGLKGGHWEDAATKCEYVFELKRQLGPQNIAITFPDPKDRPLEGETLFLFCQAKREFAPCIPSLPCLP